MNRTEEIVNYAKSYQGKGVEIEELKDIIKLAIIDGALWADDNPKWEPSNEQMWALSTLANTPESASDTCKKTAQELLEQLKKLRGEL